MEKKQENTPDIMKTVCHVENAAFSKELTFTIDDAVNKVGFGLFQLRMIFISGLAWAADAFEIIILSILGEILSCEWTIYRWQTAALTSAVFGGMIIGCPIFGVIADKFGRKVSLIASIVMMFVFGSLSAASPSFYWMLASRTVTGFALGGVAQALTLCCEFVPTHLRGKAGFYLCYFWSLGTIGVILLAWVIMENTGNWRLLLVATALPSFIVILSLKWYPESPRYNMVSDKFDRAEKIISEMASMNRKELPSGRLTMGNSCEERGRIPDLFIREYRVSTLLLWYTCWAAALSYYGIALMTPMIIQSGSVYAIQDTNGSTNYFDELKNIAPCETMTRQDYIDLLWTSAAEFPGLILFTFLVEVCDRKKLMSISCICSSILIFLLLVPTSHKIVSLLLLFAARAIILALFQLAYIMTSEAFPTTLRAVAMGTMSGFSRIGGLISPYISQVLLIYNPIAAISVLAAFILLAGVTAACLPVETRGRNLQESHIKKETTTT